MNLVVENFSGKEIVKIKCRKTECPCYSESFQNCNYLESPDFFQATPFCNEIKIVNSIIVQMQEADLSYSQMLDVLSIAKRMFLQIKTSVNLK